MRFFDQRILGITTREELTEPELLFTQRGAHESFDGRDITLGRSWRPHVPVRGHASKKNKRARSGKKERARLVFLVERYLGGMPMILTPAPRATSIA